MNFIRSLMVLVCSRGIENIFKENVLAPGNVFTISPDSSVHHVPGSAQAPGGRIRLTGAEDNYLCLVPGYCRQGNLQAALDEQ